MDGDFWNTFVAMQGLSRRGFVGQRFLDGDFPSGDLLGVSGSIELSILSPRFWEWSYSSYLA